MAGQDGMRKELTDYPNGKHDDMIAAAGHALRRLSTPQRRKVSAVSAKRPGLGLKR
jgi:phage terminase large subunit-like protein